MSVEDEHEEKLKFPLFLAKIKKLNISVEVVKEKQFKVGPATGVISLHFSSLIENVQL